MAEKDLHELFVHTLKDVYFAENAIIKALPKMMKAATSKPLQKAFEKHLKQTEGQIARLDKVFKAIDQKAEAFRAKRSRVSSRRVTKSPMSSRGARRSMLG